MRLDDWWSWGLIKVSQIAYSNSHLIIEYFQRRLLVGEAQ